MQRVFIDRSQAFCIKGCIWEQQQQKLEAFLLSEDSSFSFYFSFPFVLLLFPRYPWPLKTWESLYSPKIPRESFSNIGAAIFRVHLFEQQPQETQLLISYPSHPINLPTVCMLKAVTEETCAASQDPLGLASSFSRNWEMCRFEGWNNTVEISSFLLLLMIGPPSLWTYSAHWASSSCLSSSFVFWKDSFPLIAIIFRLIYCPTALYSTLWAVYNVVALFAQR